MSESHELLVFNGIDGDTGDYDLPPMTAEELVRRIRGEAAPENLNELRFRVQQATTGHLGVKEGIDPKDVKASGWGVIFPAFPASEPEKRKQVEAIREALQPLLQWRRANAGSDRLAQWAEGQDPDAKISFRVGVDTKNGYLARNGAGPGPADPDKVPYYLLIAGNPGDIPYRFQSQLDVQYAVGRIHFDTLEEYADYAASVVAAETTSKRLARQAAFFGVANPNDPSTQRSASQLVEPLTRQMRANYPTWTLDSYGPEQATKASLASLLGGDKTPSLLFTASHGMKFGKESSRQLEDQGALLCQDWPGPQQWPSKAIPKDFYFAADDLPGSADLLGLIAFFFACYGGGTPQFNEFARQDRPGSTTLNREEIAPYPFLARLPVKMLGRSRGALAVVSHVERAWTYSFDWGKAGSQTTVFESTLRRLLDGHPIGSALEFFNERYAELSTVLSDELEEIDFGKRYDPFELAGMWTANNDARGYAIVGDPAVRLPVARDNEQPVERAVIEVRSTPVASATFAPQAAIATSENATSESAAVVLPAVAMSLSAADATADVRPAAAMSLSSADGTAEARTYVSENLENPAPGDLQVVTRQAADGAIETVVHPQATKNAGLLALHQALAGHVFA